jgi:uncharacterized protein (TIGR03437 family)
MNVKAFPLLVVLGSAAGTVHGQSTVNLNTRPTRVVGQPSARITTLSPNLVEGRELFSPQAVAVDTSVTPNILYVSDTQNNRVLGWKDVRAVNGSPADVVVGQRDRISTESLGPGTSTSSGLTQPAGIDVDRSGNLYVVDAGNNRILRYPRPLQQTGELIVPDLVLGQPGTNTGSPNQSNPNLEPSARTIMTNVPGVGVLNGSIFLDRSGNLWFTDAGNNRVLRYPAAELRPGNNAPPADLVIGQANFISRALPDFTKLPEEEVRKVRLRKDFLVAPSVVTLDDAGRLYVSDDFRRVLMFDGPFSNGKPASRLIGIVTDDKGFPIERNTPNEFTVGTGLSGGVTGLTIVRQTASGLFTINNSLFVVDTAASRLLRYDPPEGWEQETATKPGPPAKFVFGQLDLISGFPNQRQKEATASTYAFPAGAYFVDNTVYLSDTGNNRALVIPVSSNILQPAIRVQGQLSFGFTAPNLIEGRELFLYNGMPTYTESGPQGSVRLGGPATFTAGVVIDKYSSTPHLYVADSLNNRILCYNDVRRVRPGNKADRIIGQEDEYQSKVNAPNNDENAPTQTGLFRPTGLLVADNGDLWVADSGNGRVLRFPAPFRQTQPGLQSANLVIGQTSFTFKTTDITRNTMRLPIGLAFTVQGDLLVSDAFHHRVLLFRKEPGIDFTNGMAASLVFGRPGFDDRVFETEANRLDTPHHIAVDSSNRMYVCDTVKNRIVVYNTNAPAGQTPLPVLTFNTGASLNERLNGPQGIAVYESPSTVEIWVADTRNNRVFRYPGYEQLLLNPLANASFQVATPLAMTHDSLGNLYMADRSHRVGFYFPLLSIYSSANVLQRPVSPGTLASIYPRGREFASDTGVAGGTPWPRDMADTEVTWDSIATALHYVGPTQVNFIVPMSATPTGTADVEVIRKSTGQTVASATVDLGPATPGFFTKGDVPGGPQGAQQIAALNDDNTENSSGNPVGRTKVVQMFATGLGFVPGAPPDGEGAGGAVPLPQKPRVLMGTQFVRDDDVLYAGLAPGLPGVWQLNVRVPEFVPPSAAVPVVVLVNDIPSNLDTAGRRIVTTIAVKQ